MEATVEEVATEEVLFLKSSTVLNFTRFIKNWTI